MRNTVNSLITSILCCICPVTFLFAGLDEEVFKAVSRVNRGTGFFVYGGPQYEELVFFVTAEHVVSEVRVSSISYLKEIHLDKSSNGIQYVYELRPAEEWYFHPQDYELQFDTAPTRTYDVAVTIVGRRAQFKKECINNALPISLFADFRLASETERIKIMTLSRKSSPRPITKHWLKEKTLQSYMANHDKIIREAVEIWGDNIRNGDSGSLVYYNPEINETKEKMYVRGLDNNLDSRVQVYGLVSGAKVKKRGYHYDGESTQSNMGVDVIPSVRIKETIDSAFSHWKKNH